MYYSVPRTALAAMAWLEENAGADYWFLQVEIFDPHEPFTCVDEFHTRIVGSPAPAGLFESWSR